MVCFDGGLMLCCCGFSQPGSDGLFVQGLRVVLRHHLIRQEHKLGALQLHTDVQPRPADILHWVLWRL